MIKREKDYKLDIVMAVPGMPFDGNTVHKQSLGGSETAGYYLARSLADRGHRVKVFSNTTSVGTFDDVDYVPLPLFEEYAAANKHDVCIVQRAPELFRNRVDSKVNILWCHDLALKVNSQAILGTMWNIDRVAVLSAFMAGQYKQVYGLSDDDLFHTSNGIDTSLFEQVPHQKRNLKHLVYAGRPERGLDVLLERIMPELLRRDPDYQLHLCGYDNKAPHMQDFYRRIDQLIDGLGSAVVWHGHLSKRKLYELLASAGAYVYPTPSPVMPSFYEVSCILAMECQAAGLPFITSRRGALPETLHPDAAILIDGTPDDDGYIERFVDAIQRVTTDEVLNRRMSDAGVRHGMQLDWTHVAEQWEREFYNIIEQNNDDSERLALHFLRQSDVMATKALLEIADHDLSHIEERVRREYGFIDDDAAYRRHYEEQNRIERDKHFSRQLEAGPQPCARVQTLTDMVAAAGKNLKILDVGCAYGNVAATLARKLEGDWHYVGVDVEPGVIEQANEFADRWLKNCRTRVNFITADQLTDDDVWAYDVLIMAEVLEHTPRPWEIATQYERYLHPGGRVFITVPSGPWEHEGYYREDDREHVWEFDRHDMLDMFGGKPGLQIQFGLMGQSIMGTPLGHYYITYQTYHENVGKIDMARKLYLQRPRQTVSACLMAGPGAERQMDWTLSSIQVVADEIIIADTGMNEHARAIAERYGAKVIGSPDPKQVGFEVPRNLALEHANMDWVLWIDTDEYLLSQENLHKYLRHNRFDGYSIRQHHFAVDTMFNPDMPVRMFRNNGKIRFYGMIHEHPETAVNEGPGNVIVLADVDIAHTGYLNESIRRKRFVRNYPLLQRDIEAYPDRLLQKHFIMRDNMLMVTYEMESNGGKITPTIEERCRQTIELYRKHFLGKRFMFGNDTLQYYSQAVQVLSAAGRVQGFEVSLFVDASALGNAEVGAPQKFWFATREDAVKEINARAEEKIDQAAGGEFVR